ncbi:MAG: helix-turn-helix domain-containing protein [Defluviitaleaceae bacterium]|nr:helix-turn-helix domain-containing protein [Defluviitaleaceae bacterium]
MMKVTMTVGELALALGVSRPHAYKLIREPSFPVLELGRRKVIPKEAFYEWLKAQTTKERGAE